MNNPQVETAVQLINRILPLIDDAERKLKSARNWSFIDVLGGGFVVDLIKHYKLGQAGNSMEEVNFLLQQLSVSLGNINIPDDYRLQVGGFLTFSDFVFDNVLVDAYMTSKILGSIDQVRKLRDKLIFVRSTLCRM